MVYAVCNLRGDQGYEGWVVFSQEEESKPTTVYFDVQTPDKNAKRGMHVHQFGDTTNGCTSTGPHFNPHGKRHGAPTDTERHAGDLGNVQTDNTGRARGKLTDLGVKLIGQHSVIGRVIVFHSGTDDLGKGATPTSLENGNAGGRPACGVIGLSSQAPEWVASL